MSDQTIILEVLRGTDYSIDLLYADSDDVPVNLTGYTLSARVQRTPTDNNNLAVPTITVSNQGTDPGEYTFSMTEEQINSLPFDPATDHRRVPKMFPFLINLEQPSGFKARPVYGYLKVYP